jgi:hypothetical protein
LHVAHCHSSRRIQLINKHQHHTSRMSAAQELSDDRRFALLSIHEFLRNSAPDLSSSLTVETLSHRALLPALRQTLLLLAGHSDFKLVEDALFNDQKNLNASILSDRKEPLRALLLACETFYTLSNTENWAAFIETVHDWLNAKFWSPRAPQNTAQISGPETPLKSNSHRHTFSSTTRSTVGPLIRTELKDHLWTTESDGFFDRFFPGLAGVVDGIPAFPATPTQDKVLEWWQKCIDLYAQKEKSLWVWRSACNRHLKHVDGQTQRDPDLFLYPQSHAAGSALTATAQEAWRYASIVGELKCRKKSTDSRYEWVVRLGSYAREVFANQAGRGFVHSFIIVNHMMRCWVRGPSR